MTLTTLEDAVQEPSSQHAANGAAAFVLPRAWPQIDVLDTDGSVASLARALLHGASPDISIRDWDGLFLSVTATLRLTVVEQLAAAPPQALDAAGRVRSMVMECVGALDQLHAALTQERSRR